MDEKNRGNHQGNPREKREWSDRQLKLVKLVFTENSSKN